MYRVPSKHCFLVPSLRIHHRRRGTAAINPVLHVLGERLPDKHADESDKWTTRHSLSTSEGVQVSSDTNKKRTRTKTRETPACAEEESTTNQLLIEWTLLFATCSLSINLILLCHTVGEKGHDQCSREQDPKSEIKACGR